MATINGYIYSIEDTQEPLEGVSVLLFGSQGGRTTTTDDTGEYRFEDLSDGTYEVVMNSLLDLDTDGIPEWQLFKSEHTQTEEVKGGTDVKLDPVFYRPTLFPGLAHRVEREVGTFTDALEDVTVYPMLTQSNTYAAPSLPTTAGPSGAVSLGQVVEGSLRQVLGWRPRAGDPKGFVAALNQSFAMVEQQGKQIWEWTPHSYAIQADMGAVSGAQASIYARARAALDQSLPLLEGLKALRADADDQDLEATRAIVDTELTELVNELGRVGGPRLQRVETFFQSLLGDTRKLASSEEVGGQLGMLQQRFGLKREYVNTISEEENLTNFLILLDHVVSLRQSWDAHRAYFDRAGTDVFLGTQLVLLSRSLAVMAETVDETRRVMDSVFLGPAEQQAIQLELGPNQPRITIDEVLGWAEHLSTEEGPRYIREGGKDGVIALRPALETLNRLTRDMWHLSRRATTNPIRGFHTPRVQRTLQDLAGQTNDALELVKQIVRLPRPDITAVNPDEGYQGRQIWLTINGKNFREGAQVRLNRSGPSPDTIQGTNVTVVGTTQINALFDLQGAAIGPWSVVVINSDGQYDWREEAFQVNREYYPQSQPEPPPAPPPGKEGSGREENEA
jgi:hypothetical protein